MKIWAVIKDDVVIDSVLWDGEAEWQYPQSHDELIEITEEIKIGIGWYRNEEGWHEPVGSSFINEPTFQV